MATKQLLKVVLFVLIISGAAIRFAFSDSGALWSLPLLEEEKDNLIADVAKLGIPESFIFWSDEGLTVSISDSSKVKLDDLKDFPIIDLRIQCPQLTNLSFLAELKGVRSLYLGGITAHDLSPLVSLDLDFLHIDSAHNIDSDTLSGGSVVKLALVSSSVTNCDFAPHISGLIELDISYTSVRCLLPLRGLPLVYLGIGDTLVDDLRPLAGMPLKNLVASNTDVSSICSLEGMPLTSLNLGGTKVESLSALTGMPLRVLQLTRTNVSSLADLRGMPLEVLFLDRTSVEDLSDLQGMPLRQVFISSEDGDKTISISGTELLAITGTNKKQAEGDPSRESLIESGGAVESREDPAAGTD